MITTRLPIEDIADHEHTSVPRRDLEQLSSDAGAKVLRALGVRGMRRNCEVPATSSVVIV